MSRMARSVLNQPALAGAVGVGLDRLTLGGRKANWKRRAECCLGVLTLS